MQKKPGRPQKPGAQCVTHQGCIIIIPVPEGQHNKKTRKTEKKVNIARNPRPAPAASTYLPRDAGRGPRVDLGVFIGNAGAAMAEDRSGRVAAELAPDPRGSDE